MSGLVYGVGQLEAKSAKLSKTSNSESKPAKDLNTCSIKFSSIRSQNKSHEKDVSYNMECIPHRKLPKFEQLD